MDDRAGHLVIGQAGVESLYQSSLRGRAGGRNQVVDVSGRVRQVLDEVEPMPGGDLMLTLDLDLQEAAESAFAPQAEGETEKRGAVVALDPRNGDVLALVSRPAFDPNDFAGGIDAETWSGLTGDEWRPLQNRAISGVYPPGSTYKTNFEALLRPLSSVMVATRWDEVESSAAAIAKIKEEKFAYMEVMI